MKLKKFSFNQVQVIGLDSINGLYSNELLREPGMFRFTDTATLTVVCKVSEDKQLSILQASLITHYLIDGYEGPDITQVRYDEDGLFRIFHMIIPTTTWLNDYLLEFNDSPEKIYGTVYVTDYEKFYICQDGKLVPIGIDELISSSLDNASVYEEDIYTFNYDGLKECLAKHSEDLLNKLCSAKCPDKSSDDYFIRDILWMAVNVIQYLLEQGSFFEALRILHLIQGCGANICPGKSTKDESRSGCGCRK